MEDDEISIFFTIAKKKRIKITRVINAPRKSSKLEPKILKFSSIASMNMLMENNPNAPAAYKMLLKPVFF